MAQRLISLARERIFTTARQAKPKPQIYKKLLIEAVFPRSRQTSCSINTFGEPSPSKKHFAPFPFTKNIKKTPAYRTDRKGNEFSPKALRADATLRLLLQTGRDVTICPKCGKGHLKLEKTLVYHCGALLDTAQLRNLGSPKIGQMACSKQ